MRKVFIFVSIIFLLGVVAYAQQSGTLVWDSKGANTTINAPATGTFIFQLPAKSGTFALVTDIPASLPTPVPTPAVPQYFGVVNLVSGTGTVTFATAVSGCRVSDRSGNSVKYGPTANATIWQFSGVGPTVDYECR